MIDRRNRRQLRRRFHQMEPLESRTLLTATAYAVMVLSAPTTPNKPVQVETDIAANPVDNNGTIDSEVDVQVRVLSSGIYLTAAVTGLDNSSPIPTGTVDISDEQGFLGTVALGSPFDNMIVVPAGQHTFFVTYSGDDTVRPNQTSVTMLLTNPTTTAPAAATTASKFATNNAGERIRPTRFLSEVPFPGGSEIPGAVSSDNSNTGISGNSDPSNSNSSLQSIIPSKNTSSGTSTPPQVLYQPSFNPFGVEGGSFPTPLFSSVSFSITVPKITGSH